jgi:hypothetical protein
MPVIASSRALTILALAVICGSAGSCALNKDIAVSSTPSGADVFIDGRRVGTTPLTVETDDLMPNRAMDGKVSARSVILVEKAGYGSHREVLREFSLPDHIHAHLAAPSLGEHFEDFTSNYPELAERTVAASYPAKVYTATDMDAESESLFARGYVMIGFAGTMGDPVPHDEVERFAGSKGAAIAVITTRLTAVTTEARAVTAHSAGTVVSSFGSGSAVARHNGQASATAWGPNGMARASGTYSGTTSVNASSSGFTMVPASARTEFVPFAKRHFDTQVTFWRKRRPTPSGAYTETIPVELRAHLGRNTGAYVIAVEDGSPAFGADLVPGDVVVAVDGTKVLDPATFEQLTSTRGSTRTVLDVLRAGSPRRILLEIR